MIVQVFVGFLSICVAHEILHDLGVSGTTPDVFCFMKTICLRKNTFEGEGFTLGPEPQAREARAQHARHRHTQLLDKTPIIK